MPRTTTRLALAMLLAVALSSCASNPRFDGGTIDDIEHALADHGVDVCGELSIEPNAIGAVDAQVLQLATGCDLGSVELTDLVLNRFDTADDRDAAVRAAQSRARPGPPGVVWSYGPYTLHVSGQREDDVVDRTTEALDAIGAR